MTSTNQQVDNAIILAAGLSTRFRPISDQIPKALCKVKGEVLIERQIKQLLEAGIDQIYVVVGYKSELFQYLSALYPVKIIQNHDFVHRNNTGSLMLVKEVLANSYICSCDNYFVKNPFTKTNPHGYYASIYVSGPTAEWCLKTNEAGVITKVDIGGGDADIMFGHVYFDKAFSQRFVQLLQQEYDDPQIVSSVWEKLYMRHLDELHLHIKRYDASEILEFDSIEDVLRFDADFLKNNQKK